MNIKEIEANIEERRGFDSFVLKNNPDSQLALSLAYGHLKASCREAKFLIGVIRAIADIEKNESDPIVALDAIQKIISEAEDA